MDSIDPPSNFPHLDAESNPPPIIIHQSDKHAEKSPPNYPSNHPCRPPNRRRRNPLGIISPAAQPVCSLFLFVLAVLACLFTTLILSKYIHFSPKAIIPSWPFQIRHCHDSIHLDTGSSVSAAPPLLNVFQIAQPVLAPKVTEKPARGPLRQHVVLAENSRAPNCVHEDLLMDHSFAFSYGKPFVGEYSPPPCSFNRIVFNFTVTSRGRQFDRLGIMYLGDVEVFRTSTAEPTVNGIEWTYIKDMSHCHALFQIPQKIIFDLGNLIDETYTAPFNATLSASFFTVPDATLPAETIIPISARKSSSNLGSAFSLPHEPASSFIEFPRNAKRAIVTIAACGQADEEFWFANVLSSDSYAFPEIDHLLGFSPFREVQLFIDGTLAGVVWPFPIIFSGGVNPGLWRPVVGLDAFDLRERAIDITPWLAQLCDGSTEGHLFEIRVAGISDDGNKNGWLSATVGNNWVVTGKVFIWLDEPNSITTGNLPFSDAPQPSISVESSLRHNDSLTTHVQVSRSLSVSSVIVTSKGPQAASWNQKLTYTHSGELLQGGFIQRVRQLTQGNDNTASGYSSSYTYPVAVNTSFTVDNISGNFSILASVDRSLHLVAINDDILAAPLIPELSPKLNLPTVNGYNLLTRQNGSAYFLSVPKIRKSFATGTTEQHFSFDGLRTQKPNLEIYRRHVLAKDGGLLIDEKTILGESSRNILPPMIGIEKWPSQSFCGYSIRAILGRGPSGKSPAQQASGGE